jgi:hypothetical protein
MSKNFNFTEFCTTTAILKDSGQTLQSNGTYLPSNATISTITGQFLPIGSSEIPISGSSTIKITHYFITESINLLATNGDILVIGGINYQIDGIEEVNSFLGNYTCFYVYEFRG